MLFIPQSYAKLFKKSGKIRVVLLCKYLSGRHKCALVAVFCRHICRCRRNRSFTAAHVAAKDPAHGSCARKIVGDLRDGPLLRTRKLKGHKAEKGRNIRVGKRGGVLHLPLFPLHSHGKGEQEYLVKGKTAACRLQRLKTLWKMDILQSIGKSTKSVFQYNIRRQVIAQTHGRDL